MGVEDLVVDGLEDFFLGSEAGEEGQVTSQTQVYEERTRLGVHASSEHDVHKVFLLLKMISIIDDTVIDDLSKKTDG